MVLYEWQSGLNKAEIDSESKLEEDKRKRQVSVLFLQRILRGRAQQNIMYEGKEKRLALIE